MSGVDHLFATSKTPYSKHTQSNYHQEIVPAYRKPPGSQYDGSYPNIYSRHGGTSSYSYRSSSNTPTGSSHVKNFETDYRYKQQLSGETGVNMGLSSTTNPGSSQQYVKDIYSSELGKYSQTTEDPNWSIRGDKSKMSVALSRGSSRSTDPEYSAGKRSPGWGRYDESKQHPRDNMSTHVNDLSKTYSYKTDSEHVLHTPKGKERQINILEQEKTKLEDEIDQLTLLGKQIEDAEKETARIKSISSFGAEASTPSNISISTSKEKVKLKGIISQIDEALDDHFRNCDKEKEALRKEIERMSKVGHYGTTSEYEKLKNNFEDVHAELKKWKSLYKSLEDKSLQSTQKLSEEIKQYKKENAELSERLSAEMNVKVSSDETSVENVSIKNRPMTVADEYRNLCSNQWVEAKGAMDEVLSRASTRYSEERRSNYLCKILMNAEAIAKRKQQSTIQDAWQNLQQVLKFGKSRPDTHIPPSLNNAIGDLLRLSCEEQNFVTEIRELENKLIKVDKEIYSETRYYQDCTSMIKDFIKASLQLTWKMVIQRPLMKFDVSHIGYGYDESKQEIAWGSDDPRYGTTVVQRYVAPTLCHGDQVMVKGKVMLKYVGRTAGISAYHEESYA